MKKDFYPFLITPLTLLLPKIMLKLGNLSKFSPFHRTITIENRQ